MTVTVNGEARQIENGITVAALLESLRIEPARVAVEVNLHIVKKADYPGYMIHEGDNIEIVSFVGGG